MSLPPELQKKYLARFDELIAKGESIHKAMKRIPGQTHTAYVRGNVNSFPDTYKVDWIRFVEWQTSCVALLSQVLLPNSEIWKRVETFEKIKNGKSQLEWGIATLRSIKDNFERGFLADLLVQVGAEIASGYMAQAEGLLSEGQSGKFDHVPAAVLAGAVLEKALRTLCNQQKPPIPTVKPNGDRKTMSPLIDDLKKAGVFNEAKAKQLRALAGIRNHAAHGEFDQFTRYDVKQMLSGINHFLADYLK